MGISSHTIADLSADDLSQNMTVEVILSLEVSIVSQRKDWFSLSMLKIQQVSFMENLFFRDQVQDHGTLQTTKLLDN